jgi:hypothetical protein
MPTDVVISVKRVALLALALVASALAACSTGPEGRASIVPFEMYKRGDGRDPIVCSDLNSVQECASSGREASFIDCSDDRFACVLGASGVLATPKVGVIERQEYSVFGANLKVERCLGGGTSCETAVITSRCADPEICSCRYSSVNTVTTFYFSPDMGITAFNTVDHDSIAELGGDAKYLADVLPVVTYVLVAQEGFLKAPLALRRVEFQKTCGGPVDSIAR